MTAPAPLMRRDDIEKAAKDIMALLETSGLQPMEGLVAVESLYATLLLRGMDATADPRLQETARKVALRSLTRMKTRVLAWPARSEDRQ